MTSWHDDKRSHADELAFERGVNEQYLRILVDLVDRDPGLTVSTPRNNIWTGTSPKAAVSGQVVRPLVGRLTIDHEDESLGRNFYIGTWHDDSHGRVVISWAAPKAQLFFDGRRSTDELAPHVQARRRFVPRDADIEEFFDELEPGVESGGVFASSTSEALEIPEAPQVARPRLGSGPEIGERVRLESDALPGAGSAATAPRQDGTLSAEAAVRLVVERPRTGHLTSILSTLQPDQYRLVTWPDDELLVVQGHPGTGKTVIATHRAAFLTNDGRKEGAPGSRVLERVLVVGPTDQYRSHVSQVLSDLGSGRVHAESITSLMRRLADVTRRQTDEEDRRLDTVWELGRLVDQAARQLARDGKFVGRPKRDIQILVGQLVTRSALHHQMTAESGTRAELSGWLLSLKSFDNALGQACALPFLASAALATGALDRHDKFEHIIVDEAQDIRPLEWRLLLQLLDDGGSLSLFGDMNQRRSDWSFASWPELVDQTDLPSADVDHGAVFEPELLTTGYRSTRQILKFANQLLNAQDRVVQAIRDGDQPTVEKARSAELRACSIQIADGLARKHAPGLVAIIGVSPKAISDKLGVLGWSRGSLQHSWTRDGRTIVVLHPVNARGLEFDGVVVVEPKDFPQNLGRDGALYTSLTRATKELVVVHSKGLPSRLRAPGR